MSKEELSIASHICGIHLEDPKEFEEIVSSAKFLRDKTSFSTYSLFNRLHIFSLGTDLKKKEEALQQFSFQVTFPVLVSEYLFVSMPDKFECGVSDCKNYVKSLNLLNGEEAQDLSKFGFCPLCLKNKKRIPLFKFIHLHFGENPEGEVELADKYDLDRLQGQEIAEKIIAEHTNDRGMVHFVLIVSETEHFEEFDTKYYKDTLTMEEKKLFEIGVLQRKSRIFDEKHLKKYSDDNFKRRLFEYNKLKKVIKELRNADFPLVSYLYKGFKAIHDIHIKYKLPLKGHLERNCRHCSATKGFTKIRNLLTGERKSLPNVFDLTGVSG